MKTLKILEVMWFAIAFIFISIGIFHLATGLFSESAGYFIISIIAVAIGFARRKQRTKTEDKKS